MELKEILSRVAKENYGVKIRYPLFIKNNYASYRLMLSDWMDCTIKGRSIRWNDERDQEMHIELNGYEPYSFDLEDGLIDFKLSAGGPVYHIRVEIPDTF